jgi:hypothetical protein
MRVLAAAALAAGLALAGSATAAPVFFENFDGYGPAVTGAHTAGTSSTSGNSFTTQYDYRTGTASTGPNSMYDEGTWTIAANPFAVHNLWVNLGGSTNNMMILNGDTTVPATDWLSNSFAVSAGTYAYSFDLMNVCCNANGPTNTPSTLRFEFTDNNGATFNFPSGPVVSLATPGVFFTQTGSFNLASGGNLRIGLFDTNGVASGNDFAIDNISVTAVPEPMTWALMILGFGGVGAVVRRRRSAAAFA